jgi:hypothetical protein
LIALGVVFLIGSLGLGQITGGLLFLGLSAAFLAARVLTGIYGFAVPAGILAGFGGYVALEEAGALPSHGGGWFFILLGLGFLAVYVIGFRPAAIWPFFPAAALIGFGALIEGLVSAWPLASLAWVASYWPVVLIVVGLWLLVRDRLPESVRRPLGVIGGAALIVYGIVAVGGVVAAAVGPFDGVVAPTGISLPAIGGPTTTQTVTLTAPIAAGETLRVNNPNGDTLIRPGGGAEARVVATKRFSPGREPDARLTPGDGGPTLTTIVPSGFIVGRSSIDYVVELPAGAGASVESASGDITISGLTGAVQVSSASGDVSLADLSGAVTTSTISGDQRLVNVIGETRISSTSGDVQATGLVHLRGASTVSGDLRLGGVFADDATISTTSGDVTVQLQPGSAIRVEAGTTSGDVRVRGLTLTDLRQTTRSLSGTLNAGAAVLRVTTVSGDVTLTS